MRKIQTTSDTQFFTSDGWVDPDPSGTSQSNYRRRRAGGNSAAASPAAEIQKTAIGLIGMSWLLDPPRHACFDKDIGFDKAILLLEAAENIGHGSDIWLPLKKSRLKPFHTETMYGFKVHYIYIGRSPRGICVAVDAILLLNGSGGLAVFLDLTLAQIAAWLRASEYKQAVIQEEA